PVAVPSEGAPVISLRYHVVTIVAVFLSLALGLLAGSAFVQPRLVDQLKKQTAQLSTEARDLRSEITDIRSQVTALGGFADEALPGLAASAIATRLATAGKRADPANPDVLHALLSAGFLTSIGSQVSDVTLEQIGGSAQVVVVLSGGPSEEPSIAPEIFAVPL